MLIFYENSTRLFSRGRKGSLPDFTRINRSSRSELTLTSDVAMNLKQESGDKWGPVKRPLTFLFTFFHFLTFRRYWILDIGDIGVWIKIVKAVDQDAVILVECVSFVS